MNQLTLHPAAELRLQLLNKTLPQALLLSGPAGVGLLTIATDIAKQPSNVLRPKNIKGETDPNGTISIEAIRELYHHTRTKTTHRRIIIIDDAERMSHGAQNAFLKLLEEPNSSTFFILTTHSPETLLPTVRSRTQHLAIQPTSTDQARQFIISLGISDTTKQSQLLFLADGLPAELHRLITNDDYFEQNARIITDARTLITASIYQKLRLIQSYKQDRNACLKLLDSTIAILRYTLQNKPQANLITQIEQLLDARERIAANQNIALQLTVAML